MIAFRRANSRNVASDAVSLFVCKDMKMSLKTSSGQHDGKCDGRFLLSVMALEKTYLGH